MKSEAPEQKNEGLGWPCLKFLDHYYVFIWFFRKSNFLPKKICMTLYNSLFRPHMEFGILAWGGINKSKFQYRRANRYMVQHSQEKSLQKPLHDTWLKILIQTQNGDIGNPKN